MVDPQHESHAPAPRAQPGAAGGVELGVLVGLAAFAAVVRLWSIEQWSWSDAEADTWRTLTEPLAGRGDGFLSNPERLHPLALLLLRGLLAVGLLPGYGEGWLRLPFAFFGALAAPLAALVARPLGGRLAALVAGLVFALHPAQIAASQTADPLVVGATLGLCAGLCAQRGLRAATLVAIVLAGLSHPVGWLVGAGLAFAVAPGQLPWRPRPTRRVRASLRRSALLAVLLAVPALPPLAAALGVPALLLATFVVVARPAVCSAFAFAALVPLTIGGSFAWAGAAQTVSSVGFAAQPAVLLLTALGAAHAFHLLQPKFAVQPRLAALLAAAPSLVLLAQLGAGAFLHLTVFHGGRAPWRLVRDAVLALAPPGDELRVAAGRGFAPLRCYLRPNHFRAAGVDAHPGRVVVPLPARGESLDAVLATFASPAGFVALERDEWDEVRADPRFATRLEGVEVLRVFASPDPYGDASLVLLGRRAD